MVARFINLLQSHFPEDSRFLIDKFQTIHSREIPTKIGPLECTETASVNLALSQSKFARGTPHYPWQV